jgi:response regulator RpfG family c-di-GMP phosphodiesterase
VAVVDADQPDATELCLALRAGGRCPNLKVLLLTSADHETERDRVCDDQVPAPAGGPPRARRSECHARFGLFAGDLLEGLLPRVQLALRLKAAEDRSDRLAGHLLTTNGQLEQALQQRDNFVQQSQDVLIFAMAKMAEMRGRETPGHLLRMQRYSRVLAEEAMRLPAFAPRIDTAFVRMLERCVLLHDIGKVALPDHILLKPGPLDPEERSIMESHTLLGAEMLEAVARQQGANLAFLHMAIDVVRHHHERYDGAGYPDGLAGDAIPLSARIVAIADVYDAMRSRLVYKPGLSHPAVRRILFNPTQTQFDPALLVALRQCEGAFEQIFEQTAD